MAHKTPHLRAHGPAEDEPDHHEPRSMIDTYRVQCYQFPTCAPTADGSIGAARETSMVRPAWNRSLQCRPSHQGGSE
jgi:hypothetical protein